MTDLTSPQHELLDRFVDTFLDGQNIYVQGTSLRLMAAGASRDERAQLLRSLAPRYATMIGAEPDGDSWAPTLEGLLASRAGEFATFWINCALELLRSKAKAEGAFVRYIWPELKALANRSGKQQDDALVGRVALVIRVAELESGAGSLSPPELWYWGRPKGFEELLELRTAAELLEHRLGRRVAGEQQRPIEIAATPPSTPIGPRSFWFPIPDHLAIDDDLHRLYRLAALVGDQSGDVDLCSYTSVLIAFLMGDDPVSRWFERYATRTANVTELLSARKVSSQVVQQIVERERTGGPPDKGKTIFSQSARSRLRDAAKLRDDVNGPTAPVGTRHLMASYILKTPRNHSRRLVEWNLNRASWEKAFFEEVVGEQYPREGPAWTNARRSSPTPAPLSTAAPDGKPFRSDAQHPPHSDPASSTGSNSRPLALILRGPPSVGKSIVLEGIEDLWRREGRTCARVRLDDGWGVGEVRRSGGPAETRYPDIVAANEQLLLVRLAWGEPDWGTTDARGATRNPKEWVDLLKARRDVTLIRLSAPWATLRQRLVARYRRDPPDQTYEHIYDQVENDRVQFAHSANLPEVVIATEGLTHDQVVREVLRHLPQLSTPSATEAQSPGPLTSRASDSPERHPEPEETIAGYTSDDPFARVDDNLKVDDEARAFARLASSRSIQPPLSIGVFGEWGAGKTFFMGRIHHFIGQLSAASRSADESSKTEPRPDTAIAPPFPFCADIVQIRFNAWHYMETNLWASLVDCIFSQLDVWLQIPGRTRKDELFERLNTSRSLTLDAAEVLAAKRGALKEAKTRLQRAQVDHQAALLGSAFWSQVGETLAADENVKKAAARLGFGDLLHSAQALHDVACEAADVRTRAAAVSRTFRRTALGAPGIIAGAAFLLMLLAGPVALLLIGDRHPELEKILESGAVRLASLLTAIAVPLGVLVKRASSAVDGFRGYVDKVTQAVKEADPDRLTATTAENEVEQARQRLTQADAETVQLAHDYQNATGRARLNDFIRSKAIGGDYGKHLGIIASIRKDFGQLAEMLSDARGDAADREEQRRAEADYEARRDRLLETAKDGDLLTPDEVKKLTETPPSRDHKLFERVVLYIDDLDRCPPDKVVQVLQAVHLLLCFPLFVVLVAVDSRWVSRSLMDRYPKLLSEDDAEAASTSDYLEKIFQIPYWVRAMGGEESKAFVGHTASGHRGRGGSSLVANTVLDTDSTVKSPQPAIAPSSTPAVVSGRDVEQETDPEESTTATEEQGGAGAGGASVEPSPSGTDADARSLTLSEHEVEMMKELAPFVGGTPRRGIRFVNIYRVVKSSLPLAVRAELVGPEGLAPGYRALLAELAIATGAPRAAGKVLEALRKRTVSDLKGVRQLLVGTASDVEAAVAVVDILAAFRANDGAHTGESLMTALADFAPVAGRYSFAPRQN